MSTDNKALIYNYLKTKGLTDTQTAGVMAAIQHESNFNPGAYNPNDVGKPAQGFFQWRDDRQKALHDFTGTQNPSTTQQLDYFMHELDTNEKGAGDRLRSAQSPEDAAAAMANFERFKGYDDPNNSQVLARVKTTYNLLGQPYTAMTPEQIAAAGGQPSTPATGNAPSGTPTAPTPPPGILALLTGKGGTPAPKANTPAGGIMGALSALGDTSSAPTIQPVNFGGAPQGPSLGDYVNQYQKSMFKKNPFSGLA